MKGEKPSRINLNEPKPDPQADPPVCPEWLNDDSREVWDRLAPQLHEKGVLTTWDVDAFATFCEAVIHHRNACKDVDRYGVLIPGDRGKVKNPSMQIVRDTAQIIRGYAQEFGLTPSARSGITLPATEELAEAQRLLS